MQGGVVEGRLLRRATVRDIARINHYESDEYLAELRAVTTGAGRDVAAWLYLGLDGLAASDAALVAGRLAADREGRVLCRLRRLDGGLRGAKRPVEQGSKPAMTLSAAQLADYRRDGFLALEGFVPEAACDRLRARMAELLAGFDAEGVRTVFATDDQRHAQDDWFLGFRRPDPVLLRARGVRRRRAGCASRKELSINKVGHALHDLDPVFAAFSRDPSFAGLARALGLAQPLLLQSMYIFKQPRIGGEVVCHQDSSFLHTEPPSCVGLWLALEDATERTAACGPSRAGIGGRCTSVSCATADGPGW